MNKLNTALILFLLLLFRLPALSFSPASWDLGSIKYNSGIQSLEIEVYNESSADIKVDFISVCDCLTSDTVSLYLTPGETSPVNFSFNPIDENGPVSKFIIIRTNQEGLEKALFQVTGEVSGDNRSEFATSQNTGTTSTSNSRILITATKIISVKYFYSPGCRSCIHFLEVKVPEMEKKTGVKIEVERLDIMDSKVYENYISILSDREKETTALPALLIGNKLYQGEEDISENLEEAISNFSESEDITKRENSSSVIALSLIPVFLAGLLDGINPCVFSTLLFLLSSLTLAGRKRKEILIIGMFFTLAVFITYYLVGLGLFQGLRSAAVFPLIANIIKWVLIFLLLLIAVLSFHDFIKIKNGKSAEISLQLPKFLKLKIHGIIREQTRSSSMIIGSLILGVMVSVFELACTGQVYFPTIAYLVKLGQKSAFFYLFIYNISFIIPLLIVFILIYKGTGSKTITRFFQNNMGVMKISLSFLFLVLAGVVFWM